MDKQIVVSSRKWAKAFTSPVPWACISVTTEVGDYIQPSEANRVGLLRLRFWDISNPSFRQVEALDPKLFNRQQARQILDFVNEVWDKIEVLLVHCEAGLSRSPAIAAAIANVKFGEEESKDWFNRFNLNRFVYQTIIEEHYGTDSMAALIARRLLAEKAYSEPVLDEPWDCRE